MLDKVGLYKYECSLKEAIFRGKNLCKAQYKLIVS